MFQDTERRKLALIGSVVMLYAILALLNNLVFTGDGDGWATVIVSLICAGLFGATYWLGREGWAAIGTYVTAAIALFIALILTNILTGNGVPTAVMMLIALPFVVGWFYNREMWGLLIPAYVLLAIIPILYLGDSETTVPAYVMFVIALPFIVAWLMDRSKWGLLIPAYVLLANVPLTLLGQTDNTDNYAVPAYVMFAIGLPFFVVWIMNRSKWGFLIPAAILFVMGLLFFAINAGLPETLLTIGVPVVGMLMGAALLVWAFTRGGEKQKQM